MSKNGFSEDWPTEDGIYLYALTHPDGAVAFSVHMENGELYHGNTPLLEYLGGPGFHMFCGPMSKEEAIKALEQING